MNEPREQRKISLPSLFFTLLFFLLLGGPFTTPFASDLGLTEADCRCCHGTTLADRHHLLVNTGGRECLSCHPLTYNSDTLSYDLTVTRNCPLCHTGSLADRHHLLVDQVTYDCFTCHAVAWDPETLQYVADFNKNCQSSTPTTPAGTVAGTVTDQGGTGLGWVRVATANGTYSTLATAAGSYELPGVAPGNYTLVASLDGYVGTSQAISIVDGQTQTANFVLSPLPVPSTVSGIVRDANQLPVEGANVVSTNGIYATLSAADGSYTLDNIAEGDLIFTVNKVGYSEVSQTLNITPGQSLTLDFILPAAVEICTDSLDNDGNGLTDCDDPACTGTASCQPLPPEVCTDGLDNDGNTLTDCDDPVCIGTGSCESPVAEICNDAIDNNGDSLLDCEDPLCSTATYCLPENCNDDIDNNSDGLTDCEDPVCVDTSVCRPPPVEICDDGLDNDGNGFTDCDDSKCADLDSCAPPVVDEHCRNGIDDDGDGYVDCADPKCESRAACVDEICDNGLDDDADGRVDCEDRECRETPSCSSHTGGDSLNFTASASGKKHGYNASNVGDKDLSTRWWVDKERRQWLKLDLGGIYPIDRVDIHWHSLYADKYKIRVSKNGRFWKTVKEVNGSDGDLDSNTFGERDARFILIECKSPVTEGYSIYEVEVFRSSEQRHRYRHTDED